MTIFTVFGRAARAGLAVAALTAAAASGAPEAHSRALSVEYRAFVGGLPLGRLTGRLERRGDTYAAQGTFNPVALIAALFDADARAETEGALSASGLAPRRFSYLYRDSDATTTAEVAFTPAGDPAAVAAQPAWRTRSYDISLAEAAGAVDPLTAVTLLFGPRADPCVFTVKVFDSRRVHRVTLTPTGGRTSRGAHICDGVYERLAGFKPKHLAPDRRFERFEMQVLRRDDGSHLPRRVMAQTDFGAGVVVLRDWREE